VAARILVGPEEQLDPICAAMANSPLAPDGSAEIGVPIVSFVACGAIVRKSAFVEAGGFDAHFGIGGEEEVLALDLLRKGWQMVYVAGITAHHHPSPVRDVARRHRHQIRNALWSLWLRRPAKSALISSWHIVASAMGERPCRMGLVEALAGLQWVLRARRPVPLAIERQVRKTESAFYSEHGRPPAAYSDSA
jgi:GT2 family glycosyltransferase